MNKIFFFMLALSMFSADAFADIAGGRRVPKPTPTPVTTATPEATPAVGPKPKLAEYNGNIRIYLSREVGKEGGVPVLEIRRTAVEMLLASNGGNISREDLAGTDRSPGVSSAQTIVRGTLFSLAFIVGGIWIFRSKGTSKTAAGVLLGAALGAGTVVLANSPPDYVVTLTSRIFAKNTRAYRYAKNKVKIRLVEEREYAEGNTRDDVVLIVPKDESEDSE